MTYICLKINILLFFFQIEVLQRKPHIVVATPGRLLDLVDDGALFLQPQPSSTTATVGACPCLVITIQPSQPFMWAHPL